MNTVFEIKSSQLKSSQVNSNPVQPSPAQPSQSCVASSSQVRRPDSYFLLLFSSMSQCHYCRSPRQSCFKLSMTLGYSPPPLPDPITCPLFVFAHRIVVVESFCFFGIIWIICKHLAYSASRHTTLAFGFSGDICMYQAISTLFVWRGF